MAEHRCPVPCPPPSRAGLHVSKSGAPQLGLRALFPPFSPFSTHAGGRGLRLGLGVSPGAPRQPAGWEGSGHGSCLMGRAWAAPVLPGEKFACPPRAAGGCHRPCHLQGWGNRDDLCEGRGCMLSLRKGSGAAVGAGIPQAAPCCEAGRAGGGIWSLLTAAVSRRATNQRVKWPLSLKIRAATPKMLLGNLAGLGALERAGLSFAAIGIRPRRAAPGALRGAATQRGARPCVCTHVGVCTRVWLRV